MNFFDDEPSAGGGYEDVFPIPIWDSDGIARRILVRHRGHFERVAIVLEEQRDGLIGHLVRYDDAHGRFHRHEPGWPQPSATIAVFSTRCPHGSARRWRFWRSKGVILVGKPPSSAKGSTH